MANLIANIENLLQGEPARMISYGAIVLVGIISFILVQLGVWASMPNLVTIEGAVTVALVAFTELIRHFVFSPNSAADLQAQIASLKDALAAKALPPA